MIKTQKKYIDYIEAVQSELQHSTISSEGYATLSQELENLELLVPVIGGFSAGKSSLLNAFLGKEYLAVGMTPETSLASELRYSESERIEAVRSDNTVDTYGIDDMYVIKEKASEYRYIKVFIANQQLKDIEPLILVDMPGFESPVDLHNQAILQYISKGVHFIVLTSVEDGNITHSMIRELSNIQEYGRDFSFFLSKANLKSENEVAEISEVMQEQLEDSFDINKTVISVGDNGGDELGKILNTVDAEELFTNIFKEGLENEYFSILEKINTSISALKKDEEDNEYAVLELKKAIVKTVQKRDDMLLEAEEKYSNIKVDRIIKSVGKELSDSLDELVTVATTRGEDALGSQISDIMRYSLTSNIKNSMDDISSMIVSDLTHELSDVNSILSSFTMEESWLEKISESTEKLFQSTNSGLNNILQNRQNKKGQDALYKAITTVLAVTTSVLAPILEIVIIFLPDILAGLLENYNKDKQKEQIKEYILTSVIPSIKRELKNKLPNIFKEQVDHLITQISTEFEETLKEKEEIIQNVENEKSETIENIQIQVERYEQFKNRITTLFNDNIFLRQG